MRSRTEMVTTTFVDSEEDYSDDDDSEEDWRPSASSKNGKKQKHQKSAPGSSKKGRKRKGPSSGPNAKSASKRRPAYEESDEDDEEDEDASEDDYDYDDFETASGSAPKSAVTNLPPKKKFSEKNSTSGNGTGSSEDEPVKLLVYVKDLVGDYSKNNRLCLWRKDNNNLLQKYIRVKTTPDEFLFTSSSVYSSFDDKRITDFYDIKIKSLDSSKRRVKIANPLELRKIASEAAKKKGSDDSDAQADELSDDISESELEKKEKSSENKENVKKKNMKMKLLQKRNHADEDDDDDDDEEEVEEENDEEEDDGNLECDDDDDEDVEDDDDGDDD